MSKLYFKYGAMNSGKTTALLQCANNYEERGMQVVILKPVLDTRDADLNTISSRVAGQHSCFPLKANEDPEAAIILARIENWENYPTPVNAVLVDEAQFLTPMQVDTLSEIADTGIPVMCYGLRTDFMGELFPGSARLLAIADNLEEIKTVCHCGKKATMVLRLSSDGRVVTQGGQVCIGGNESYVSVCRKHFLSKTTS